MYNKISLYFLLILGLILQNVFANELDNTNKSEGIEEILKKNPSEILRQVDASRAPNTSFLIDMEVIDENLGDKSKFVFNLKVGVDGDKSFAIYKSPATQKGNSILSIGTNIWIYVNGTKNPIKISPQQKLIGQASVADVMSLLYYPNYTVVSYKKDNQDYLLTLKAKDSKVSYDKLDLRLSDKLMPKEVIFYALSGKQIKIMRFKDEQELLGKNRPSKMIIEDHINKNLVTTVIFKSMEEKNISKSHFNKDNINKLSGLY